MEYILILCGVLIFSVALFLYLKHRKTKKVIIPPEEEVTPEKEGKTIEDGLEKTRKEGFVTNLLSLIRGKTFDDKLLEKFEEILITADIGVKTTEKILENLKKSLSKSETNDEKTIIKFLKKTMGDMLKNGSFSTASPQSPPEIILVVGVNGTGKTTTIGKIAYKYKKEGKKVMLIAGDTFRAAAGDQLEIWAKRVESGFFGAEEKKDPSSVIYDGIKKAINDGYDVAICDTAGRLHTRLNLVEELKKVKRVCGKAKEGAPHKTILVLDATTGQNALQQARIFKESLEINGIALAKLDGTAKGGICLAISDELQIPILLVGTGEKKEDLKEFDAEKFVDALFKEEQNC